MDLHLLTCLLACLRQIGVAQEVNQTRLAMPTDPTAGDPYQQPPSATCSARGPLPGPPPDPQKRLPAEPSLHTNAMSHMSRVPSHTPISRTLPAGAASTHGPSAIGHRPSLIDHRPWHVRPVSHAKLWGCRSVPARSSLAISAGQRPRRTRGRGGALAFPSSRVAEIHSNADCPSFAKIFARHSVTLRASPAVARDHGVRRRA